VDPINDVTGVELALDQRWQTKRGGPDRWRSVDVFTLNMSANLFTHKPPTSELAPVAFRGLFFDSLPEDSIPRDSLNSDATWRLSDSTAVLSDAQYNLDQHVLATASIGLAVQRDTRLGYFIGTRYIHALNSNVSTVAFNYALTARYTLAGRQNYDFGVQHAVGTNVTLIRHFDRFFVSLTVNYDEIARQSGIAFNIWPEGLGAGVGTERLKQVFGQ
jgi:hypothetical protein